MRLLVLSDSHGRRNMLYDAITLHPEADAVIFLGDGERDFASIREQFPSQKFYAVCGNCDFYSMNPAFLLERFDGKLVYGAHGHNEGVKHSLVMLAQKAQSCGASIALYGHTHVPDTRYENGVLLFNPGSASLGRYGMIDITDKGIMPILAEL